MKKLIVLVCLVLLSSLTWASTWHVYPKSGGDLGVLTYNITNRTATYMPAPGTTLAGTLTVYDDPNVISCFFDDESGVVIRFTFYYEPALNLPAGEMVMDAWYSNFIVVDLSLRELAITMVRQ